MNIKSKRFAIVLLTLVFTVSVFAVTAFATGSITPSSEVSAPSSSKAAPSSGTPTETSSASGGKSSSSSAESSHSSSHTSTSSHTSSLAPDSSHKETHSSKPEAPSRVIDTQAHRVEATASQAAQAVKDPDVLSSENWSELLSSGNQANSQNGAGVNSAVSSTASPKEVGGVSWILILGIVLIVLALCGFGLFVYLQFFSDNHGGGNGRGGRGSLKSSTPNAPAQKNGEEPLTFTDINSASDGKQHREDYVPNDAPESVDIHSTSFAAPVKPVKPAVKPRAVKKSPISNTEITRQIPQDALPQNNPAVTEQGSEPLSKSQATRVSDNSNFDWEKFFNDQK